MIVWKQEQKTVNYADHYVCDRCGNISKPDSLEGQEYMSYMWMGGYSSIFGDGQECEIQLCQHCVKALLGPYIQYK